MRPNAKIYQHPAEVWDEKKCARLAKQRWRDGMGTQMTMPGYIGCSQYMAHRRIGTLCYNGEHYPLPIVAPGYELKHVISWGWFITLVKESTDVCSQDAR